MLIHLNRPTFHRASLLEASRTGEGTLPISLFIINSFGRKKGGEFFCSRLEASHLNGGALRRGIARVLTGRDSGRSISPLPRYTRREEKRRDEITRLAARMFSSRVEKTPRGSKTHTAQQSYRYVCIFIEGGAFECVITL